MAKHTVADTSTAMEAEYSPWLLIFRRIEDECNRLHEISAMVQLRDRRFIEPYAVSLNQLYKQLLPLMTNTTRVKEYEKQIKEIRDLEIRWKNNTRLLARHCPWPTLLVDKLEVLEKKLLVEKQFLGLGVPATTKQTNAGKMKNILG